MTAGGAFINKRFFFHGLHNTIQGRIKLLGTTRRTRMKRRSAQARHIRETGEGCVKTMCMELFDKIFRLCYKNRLNKAGEKEYVAENVFVIQWRGNACCYWHFVPVQRTADSKKRRI
jgi:hypothetical protein